jgi:hypothetical protein
MLRAAQIAEPVVWSLCHQALRYGANHIIRRQRPPDPLQLELADRLDLHRILNLHQHSRTDEDLSGLRLVA